MASFLVCSLIFIEYQFEWKMGSFCLVMIQATFLQSILLYTQLFSKSNLVHCLLTVDFKTLFSSP
ncbi:hypothetical protein E3V84_11095 [Streptococcus pseudopneumoniae]|nr:hypothetical protein E3V84_11095 [Streptococcus pseudopneumoniae]